MAVSEIEIKLKIEAGKSYKLRIPSSNKKLLIHIDYILDNPVREHENRKLIVYRYWVRRRVRWVHDVIELWVLDMYNNQK